MLKLKGGIRKYLPIPCNKSAVRNLHYYFIMEDLCLKKQNMQFYYYY